MESMDVLSVVVVLRRRRLVVQERVTAYRRPGLVYPLSDKRRGLCRRRPGLGPETIAAGYWPAAAGLHCSSSQRSNVCMASEGLRDFSWVSQ
ncbi:hypothetical protein GCM10027195_15880 [Comamonas sediminis]